MGFFTKIFGTKKEVEPATAAEANERDLVKVLFRFYSGILEQNMVETMWAKVLDADKGLYQLDNIPLYIPLVASDDIVFAEFDASEERLTYRRTVEHSGNSTVHIVMMNRAIDKESVRDIFKKIGCTSEGVNEGYFALEIPSSLNYKPVKLKLDELERDGVIGYAESCLSSCHQP